MPSSLAPQLALAMDICSRFRKLGSQDADDLTDIKQAILRAQLDQDSDESDGDENSDVELYDELGADKKMAGDGMPSDEEDEELEVALQRIFVSNETSTSLNLVSALKGSRGKQGLISPKKKTVTWAPDVYDPEPTTEICTIRGTKQKKSRKNDEKKCNDISKGGKKVQKGSSSSRGSGSHKDKDKKQFRRKNRGSNDDCEF